jgi:hypothetical protein
VLFTALTLLSSDIIIKTWIKHPKRWPLIMAIWDVDAGDFAGLRNDRNMVG